MNDHKTLLELTHLYADGIATSDQLLRLQELLRDDVKARRSFLTYMELDGSLANLGAATALCDSEIAMADNPSTKKKSVNLFRSKRMRHLSLAAVAAVAVCLMLMVLTQRFGGIRSASWARVIEASPGVNLVKNDQTRPAKLGDLLGTEELIAVPEGGTAQITVAGLGVVTLGPEARLRSGAEPRLVELESGFAEVAAEKQVPGRPWRIRTPQVEVSVLGTEFNLATTMGRTALRVSEGVVKLTSLDGGKSEHVHGGNRAIIAAGLDPVLATSRPGSVLLLTSVEEPWSSEWERFNRILVEKLVDTRMWQLGFRVEEKHFRDVRAADLEDRSLVIVSLFEFGVGEPAIERIGLARADVPVLCLEPAAYPALDMTTETEDIGFGFERGSASVEFLDATHPLSGGYEGRQDQFVHDWVSWGRPENEAERIGQLYGQPDRSVMFGYDTGRQMATFAAPARRVGLFLDPTNISEQTTMAWTVFEAAIDWCVE